MHSQIHHRYHIYLLYNFCLYSRIKIILTQVRKVDAMFNAALYAVKTCDRTSGCTDSQHTPCLQKKIMDYFNADNDNSIPNKMAQTRLKNLPMLVDLHVICI